jgi:acetyl-CoA carboxylase carboxyl transferase subunit beta
VPDDLWVKCPQCDDLIYTKEFERSAKVCQKCNYHFRLGARERIDLLADDESFTEHDGELRSADPLEFASATETYVAKLEQTVAKTGLHDAVIAGSMRIEKRPVEITVADFNFLGASMGSVFGEKVARASERALARRVPLLTVSASGGARMHEGIFSLMQMAKTSAALGSLARAAVPHISLLTDPCFGGVTASFAMQADVILAEPGALIGFAGARVIEQTIRQKLPEGFQTAEFQLQHGMIDALVPRRELRAYLATLLGLYQGEQQDDSAE